MSNPDYNNIDDYLLNNLTDPEMKQFEQQLALDPELSAEVEARRELLAIVDIMGDIRMKERVRQVRQSPNVVKMRPQHKPFAWRVAIAASLLLVAGALFWLWKGSTSATPEKLYAEYYEPYTLNFGSRSADTEQQLAEAGNFYKAGQYADALPIFEGVIAQNPTDAKARLAAGICQIELGKNDEALATFKPLIDNNDPLFQEQALWYSAMAALKMGDKAASKLFLEKLSGDAEGQFYEKAVEVLKLL